MRDPKMFTYFTFKKHSVLFPGVIIPITIGRDRSIKLIKETYKGDKIIGVLSQKDPSIEVPKLEDLNNVGTGKLIS